MPATVHLTSSKNARVKAAVRLRSGRHRRESGLFIAEGRRQIERAVDAGLEMVELFSCPSLLEDDSECAEELRSGVQTRFPELANFTVAPGVFAAMAYRNNPEGILAVFRQRVWDLDAVLSQPGSGAEGGLWLVAVSIEKPGNLGALARSAAAAGASGMLVADAVVDVVHPNALAASTGAVLRLPIAGANSDQIIAALTGRGIRIVAATPGIGGVVACSYLDADLTGPVAIVIGAEDVGLTGRWLGAGDGEAAVEAVSIPMPGGAVDSLNAAAAAAVLLFEAARQRLMKSSADRSD